MPNSEHHIHKLTYSRMRPIALGIAALLAVGGLAGCLGGDPGTGGGEEPVVIGVPSGWLGEEMRSYMLQEIITNELGHEVQMFENVEAGAIYASLGTGDTDVFVGAWLPIQQTHLESQPEGSIIRIGHSLPPDEVKLGVAVPQYVYDAGVTSLADLSEYPEEFDRTITGVEPGFGMMIMGEQRISEGYYDLGDWTLQEGSTAGMLASYDDAVNAGEWIVVLTWEPHFMHAKWQGDQAMVYLDDPGYELDGETVYLYKEDSENATVETLAPAGIYDEYPDVAALLENFQVPVEDENELMLQVDQGGEPRDVALQYLEDNPERVQQWLADS